MYLGGPHESEEGQADPAQEHRAGSMATGPGFHPPAWAEEAICHMTANLNKLEQE